MRFRAVVRSLCWFKEGLLRRALLVNVMLAVALSSLITVVYIATAKQAFRRQLEARAESLASFIAAEAAYPLLVGDEGQLRRVAQSALRDEDVLSVAVSDAESRISFSLRRPGAPARSLYDSSINVRTSVTTPADDPLAGWDRGGENPKPLGSVEVRLSRGSEQALYQRTIERAIKAGALALLLILTIQYFHFRQLLSPLQTLAEFTRHVGRGDLRRKAPVVRRDEIGELALSFNDMVDRLSETTVSRDYVDNIVRSMGDALLVTDPDLTVQTSNGAAARLFGESEERLIGRPLGDLVERVDVFAGLLQDATSRIAHSFEENLIGNGGHRIPAMITASVLRGGAGEVQGLVCLAQDITERKKVQQALVDAKNAAEESSLTKSNFLANMSHELRTPLNAIINYSEILLEDAEAEERQQDAMDLKQIRSSGKHLLALINDVLDLSKIEAGRMQVCLETLEVDEILSEVTATCAAMAQKNGTALTVENVDCDTVRADAMKLKQILINLVGNACKFTERGSVSVRVYRAYAGGEARVCWDVRDTGAGIAPEDLGKLFKSFTQVDPSNTRKHGGTGLGLAISQRLAGLMGGRIAVVSTLSVGSTFTLELPADASTIAAAAAPYETTRRTVLIVDEDPRSLAVCLKAWNAAGYTAEFATTPGEAVRKARTLRPFLVVVNQLAASSLDAEATANAVVVLYSAAQSGDNQVVSLASSTLVEDFRRIAEEALTPAGDVAALMKSLSEAAKAEESGVKL